MTVKSKKNVTVSKTYDDSIGVGLRVFTKKEKSKWQSEHGIYITMRGNAYPVRIGSIYKVKKLTKTFTMFIDTFDNEGVKPFRAKFKTVKKAREQAVSYLTEYFVNYIRTFFRHPIQEGLEEHVVVPSKLGMTGGDILNVVKTSK